jgi:hypothetical protein
MSGLEFYLTALDNEIDVALASISAEDTNDDLNLNTKAVAQLYCDASAVRQVFKYATNAADLTDVSDEDMYFFVDANGFKNLFVQTTSCENNVGNTGSLALGDEKTLENEICRAWVFDVAGTVPAIDFDKDAGNVLYTVDNKSMIKDLMRDMAHQLFGTQYGVDIFQNEQDLCDNTFANTKALFSAAVGATPGGAIWEVLNDASGMNVSQVDPSNIGQVIFRNIVANDPERLQDISSNFDSDISMNTSGNESPSAVVSGSDGNNTEMRMYRMPFASGDSLIFHLNYKYNTNQRGVVENNGTASSPLNDRLYKVILTML